MCGIVGYIGDRNAVDIILEGLKRLEYRGYDSAGIAVVGPEGLQIRRAAGPHQDARGTPARAAARRRASASATRAGPPTAGPPTRTRTRTPTARASSSSSTTASSRTTCRSRSASQPEGHVFTSRDRHRGHRAPDRAASRRTTPRLDEAVRRALPRAARLLRGRRAAPGHARPPRGGQARRGQRGGRPRRGRDLPGLRHPRHPRAHARRGDPRGRRRRGGHAARGRDHPARRRPGAAARRRASCGIRSSPRRAATGTSC